MSEFLTDKASVLVERLQRSGHQRPRSAGAKESLLTQTPLSGTDVAPHGLRKMGGRWKVWGAQGPGLPILSWQEGNIPYSPVSMLL